MNASRSRAHASCARLVRSHRALVRLRNSKRVTPRTRLPPRARRPTVRFESHTSRYETLRAGLSGYPRGPGGRVCFASSETVERADSRMCVCVCVRIFLFSIMYSNEFFSFLVHFIDQNIKFDDVSLT